MKTEESRLFIKSVWEAFASRDESLIASKFAPDAEWIAPVDNATARAFNSTNEIKGRDSIARFIATDMRRLFQDVKIEFKGFFADGPIVIVEERMSARLPNHLPYVVDYCFVFVCNNGLVVQVREYMDTLSGDRQIFAKGDPFSIA